MDSPLNAAEIHFCSVGMVPNNMERTTMREICTMQSVPTSKKGKQCGCYNLDQSVYDDAMMITKMIGGVSIVTAHRELQVSFVGTKDRHSHSNAEAVAKRFRCGIETAQKTQKATTQRGVWQLLHPLNRRYRVDHLNLNRRRLINTFYMDTLFSTVKSLGGNTCA
jgi:hypothetical protein